MKKARPNTATIKHSKERETPLPVYVGLTVHAQTRKKELVDSMFTLGLSVSYSRVLEISTELASKVCSQFQRDGVVCPMKLRSGLFTTAAVDNLDHNPLSTTATDAFHGTAISLFQHPIDTTAGDERTCANAESQPSKKLSVPDLPEFYRSVHPFTLKLPVEPLDQNVHATEDTGHYVKATETENQWLQVVETVVSGVEVPASEYVSWGAYHVSEEKTERDRTPGISSLLPLFHESSKSPAMMKHAMEIITKAIKFLNPAQNPVIACDQPLFALAKQIQWRHPDLYGENRMTIMLGGLHSEMAFLNALGSLLRDSGWTDVLVQAGVTSVGIADSLSASHVTRTRHAHHLTVCALYQLMNAAYEQYRLSCQVLGEEIMSLDEWKVVMLENSPTFHFWALIMQLEVLLFVFMSSLRSGDFTLYQQTIPKMMPVFFALDQQNYARWMSVHVNDMRNISATESVCH